MDTIKTIICIASILIATVAYLRSDVETMGVLKQQYTLEDQLAELKADYMMVCEEVMDAH